MQNLHVVTALAPVFFFFLITDNFNDADDHNILLKGRPRTTLYPRLLAYLELEKEEREVQKTTTPTISTSEHSWDEPQRSWSKEQACKKNDDNRSTLYKSVTSLNFLNPQIFLSGFKDFHVHTQRIQIELSRPQVREITLISSAGLKSDLRLMRYFSHHSSAKKKKLFADKTSHQALVAPVTTLSASNSSIAHSKISTLESGFKKVRIRMPDSPDTCGRKPKKLQIQKYPDTCLRDLRWTGMAGPWLI